MYNEESSPTLDGCTFVGQSAFSGGGIYNRFSDSILTACTFIGNTSTHGGGVQMIGSNPTLTNCLFMDNTGSYRGGGVGIVGHSSPVITNCLFLGNYSANGGAVNTNGVDAKLTNCLFSGNTANRGGAIETLGSTAGSVTTLANCTLAGNSAPEGSAFALETTSSTLPTGIIAVNCILWNGGDEVWDSGHPGITIEITYSDVQGGWSGTGNINALPLFVDADGLDDIPGTEDDDLRLSPDSPCVDAGFNDALPPDTPDLDGDGDTDEPIPFDLDALPRIVNWTVDMGAYEYQHCEGVNCDDGLYCNGLEWCFAGECLDGIPPDCDDGVDCTVDDCDEDDDLCVSTPDDGLCDNGQYCDGVETCDPDEGCGSEGDPCTALDLLCDEESDRCVECLSDGHCNDGDPCTEDGCDVDGFCEYVNVCGACCLPDGGCEQATEVACAMMAGEDGFRGVGSVCLGDNDGSGYDDACEPWEAIPTVSEWGLVIMALVLLTTLKVYFGRRRPAQT
jgi:predicted outer membrane repeat protein